MNLGELAGHGTTMEFVNRRLCQILATGDVDRGEPALFAPAPHRAGRDADLFHPFGHADDRPATRLILCRVCFHTRTLNARDEAVRRLGRQVRRACPKPLTIALNWGVAPAGVSLSAQAVRGVF